MKTKALILTIAVLFSAVRAASAQESGAQAAVVSSHAITLSTIGVDYSYEQRLGGSWSLIGRAGLAATGFNVTSGTSSFEAGFEMGCGIAVEPRYYTSLDRRAAAGKSTYGNSSDFIAVRAQAVSYGDGAILSLIPMYGIRRSGGKHWFHEFSFGARLNAVEGGFGIMPYAHYRLGFTF